MSFDSMMEAYEEYGERLKRDEWHRLLAIGVPNPVELHDRFCAVIDAKKREARQMFEQILAIYDKLHQVQQNLVIAVIQGEMGEARQVVGECSHLMQELSSLQPA